MNVETLKCVLCSSCELWRRQLGDVTGSTCDWKLIRILVWKLAAVFGDWPLAVLQGWFIFFTGLPRRKWRGSVSLSKTQQEKNCKTTGIAGERTSMEE